MRSRTFARANALANPQQDRRRSPRQLAITGFTPGGKPMADNISIKVNGQSWPVHASPDTPLLYVLTNELELHGPRFGCGLAQCGSCSVLLDGVEIRSCSTP